LENKFSTCKVFLHFASREERLFILINLETAWIPR
jgi:hypothetical protein